MSVDIVWGMWGTGSFGQGEEQCRTVISGVSALVSTRPAGGEKRCLVWYLTGTVHEPLVSAWSSRPEDAALLEAVTTSGVFAGAPRK
jgi:hypothetical protein